MKIGEFSSRNNVSIHTIRHYMELGLVNPVKKGGQYDFDEICQNNLEMIMELKQMGFSLSRIKTIFLYSNIGKLTDYERNAYFQSIFLEKYEEVQQEIEALKNISEQIQTKITNYSTISESIIYPMGVHLSVLPMLKCTKCKGNLTLEDGLVQYNQIMDGKLICCCGESYRIQSGILSIGIPYENTTEFPIEDYLNSTDSAYLDNINKDGEWAKRKLTELDLSNKVILEMGSGWGFFLRNVYSSLPEDCLYIAVDRNIDSQLFLKRVLEHSGVKRNILFICADFLQLPLEHHSIDIVIDQVGTSNYSFENDHFLLHSFSSFLKAECYLIGSYFAFKNFSTNSKIEAKFRENFFEKQIKNNLTHAKFDLIDERYSELLQKSGPYENFFVDGEKVYTYSFFGKSSG